MSDEPFRPTLDALVSAAKLFRLGMDTQANQALAGSVTGLAACLAQRAPAERAMLDALLALIVEAQERADVLRIADLIEFELLPRLLDAPADAPLT